MLVRSVMIDGLEFDVRGRLYESEFKVIYADYVLQVGGGYWRRGYGEDGLGCESQE